jgi:hypothetical protein
VAERSGDTAFVIAGPLGIPIRNRDAPLCRRTPYGGAVEMQPFLRLDAPPCLCQNLYVATNVPPTLGQPPPPKKTPWLLYACGTLLALVLIVVATIAITLWWLQRPIKPVVLSPQEKVVAENKVRYAEEPESRAAKDKPGLDLSGATNAVDDRPYVPGGKVLKLTEREINGLLNANTDLGKTVRLQFDRDAINAYLVTPIPDDVPILGGKMFRARGRFRLSIGNGGAPFAVLEDVTVFGLSLPKAWLGGIKGENLFGDALGQGNGGPVLKGIKSLRIEPGALVLEVED